MEIFEKVILEQDTIILCKESSSCHSLKFEYKAESLKAPDHQSNALGVQSDSASSGICCDHQNVCFIYLT